MYQPCLCLGSHGPAVWLKVKLFQLAPEGLHVPLPPVAVSPQFSGLLQECPLPISSSLPAANCGSGSTPGLPLAAGTRTCTMCACLGRKRNEILKTHPMALTSHCPPTCPSCHPGLVFVPKTDRGVFPCSLRTSTVLELCSEAWLSHLQSGRCTFAP